ncbi:MAG TPA: penicillin acylase family protein, partial [Gemmatimonadales bacterium]|nr:penicillin acylase family protein [Gemmatimonadales bacterium]
MKSAISAALGILWAATAAAQSTPAPDLARWQAHAAAVTITRDDWGIAHVRGRTDADAVFGMVYAQAEDDFNRIETNYLNAMGRLAEAEGDSVIWRDLRMKFFISPDSLKAWYARSPAWLRTLMNAWADGLNFYLQKHPEVKPRVLTRFEPWMALSFTEGSIGGDIEQINLRQLRAFYDSAAPASQPPEPEAHLRAEPTGSNGIAIAPSRTARGHALLLINPHTSFYFRSELQMTSAEGLNAYGAVTWGQFFVYQGFNQHAGWMHTSSGVDNIDEYRETIVERDGRLFYHYGSTAGPPDRATASAERPVTVSTITVPYRTAAGMAERKFTVYRTHHGPVVRRLDDKWVSVRLMQDPIKALTQSYSRTRVKDYPEFRQVMELHTNSSNNTIFADAKGNIAYFHSNFIPRRDPRFDWSRPVDGSDPATEWQGILSVDESPNLLNPATGWLYNANNWPWSAAGPASPKREAYPGYVETGREETPRGLHALRVLADREDFTVASLRAAAYDSYLTAFEKLIPPLLQAWEETPDSDPLEARLAEPIGMLRAWDFRWSETSIPTSLAVFWGEEIARRDSVEIRRSRLSIESYIASRVSLRSQLEALAVAVDRLAADFGTWRTPWGQINRFQRLTRDLVHPFNDSGPSIPVGFTSARWGSLASFGARAYPGTKKWYGTSGNSFVAVVEFGDSVRAVAVTAGGESSDPKSPHFND